MPHCAICARYSTDTLPFLALLSFIETTPVGAQPEALVLAEQRLERTSSTFRQVLVRVENFPVHLDSPAWSLVRHLIVDLSDERIDLFFEDQRLSQIEELTLLGFEYGCATLTMTFVERPVNLTALRNVRSLVFHSTTMPEECQAVFWKSPFAQRLERIVGVPYEGQSISSPLAVRELEDVWFGESLLNADASPQLLSVKGYLPSAALLGEWKNDLERLETLDLSFGDIVETHGGWREPNLQTLDDTEKCQSPGSLRSLTCRLDSNWNCSVSVAGEQFAVFRANRESVVVTNPWIADFMNLVFELDALPGVSEFVETYDGPQKLDQEIR